MIGNFLHSIVLAFVQGFTEFLPVSSSAHLLFFRKFFNICNDHSFDVFLNLGTLCAVLYFFSYETKKLFLGGVDFILLKQSEHKSLFLDVLIASIPTFIVFGIVELFLGKQTESISILCCSLILFSFVIYFCDKSFETKKMDWPSRKEWLLIGIVQVFSIVPGISRLGATSAAFRALKYDRVSSFKYSLILSIPAVSGACFLKGLKFIKCQNLFFDFWQMIVCLGLSFIVGVVTLRIVLNFLKVHTYFVFIVYRIIFGLLVLYFMF